MTSEEWTEALIRILLRKGILQERWETTIIDIRTVAQLVIHYAMEEAYNRGVDYE